MKKDWEKKGIDKDDWPSYVGNSYEFTPLGLTQVAAVSEKLQSLEPRFDFIAASPLWRSRNTILPYMKEVGAQGEVWTELKEHSSSDLVIESDLPSIPPEDIFGQGREIELPPEETEYFTVRADGGNNSLREFSMPDFDEEPYGSDAKWSEDEWKGAASKVVTQPVVDRLLKEFGGTEKSILLAGHNSAGQNLLSLLLGKADHDGIDNTGIWMVEQQADGAFKLMMYNSEFLADTSSGVTFKDLNADLSKGKINGYDDSDSEVSISREKDGDDYLYSLSIKEQDFDGDGVKDDSLSWDIRVKAFEGSTVVLDGNNSSVTLGSSYDLKPEDKEFGLSSSDDRYVDEGESIQFSVENIVLDADTGIVAEFQGFTELFGSEDTYIFGVGIGELESLETKDDDHFTFSPREVLTLTASEDKFRVRSLGGVFTLKPDPSAIPHSD